MNALKKKNSYKLNCKCGIGTGIPRYVPTVLLYTILYLYILKSNDYSCQQLTSYWVLPILYY